MVRVDFIGFVLYDLYNKNVIGQKVFETLNTKSRKAFMALVQGLRSINAKFGFDPITATLTFSLELEDISHPEFTLADDCLSGYFRKHGRHSGENSLFFVGETIGNSRQATPSLFPDRFFCFDMSD